MKAPKPCRLETLAQHEMCAVEHCRGCGTFHLNIGFATMRLPLAALRGIAATLVAALERYDRRTAGTCPDDQATRANDNLH